MTARSRSPASRVGGWATRLRESGCSIRTRGPRLTGGVERYLRPDTKSGPGITSPTGPRRPDPRRTGEDEESLQPHTARGRADRDFGTARRAAGQPERGRAFAKIRWQEHRPRGHGDHRLANWLRPSSTGARAWSGQLGAVPNHSSRRTGLPETRRESSSLRAASAENADGAAPRIGVTDVTYVFDEPRMAP